jgi:plastocyanin
MNAMRTSLLLVAALLVYSTADLSAQTTSPHVHQHDSADAAEMHRPTQAELTAWLQAHSSHGPIVPQSEVSAQAVSAAATKTFNIVARQFVFDVTPSAFVVNQGDTVTINLSVPSNDKSPVGHGLLMDTYVMDGINAGVGQSRSVTFVATTPGTYAFVCTQSLCGTGHTSMFGQMTVNAVTIPAPSISGITPSSASAAGGTVVTINGANFQSGATVTFGSAAATNVSVTASSITATVPPGTPGAVTVRVTNPDNQSATFSFTYSVPAPAVTSVNPATGPTSGNTEITIHGNGFAAGATVTIGGVAAKNVNVVDAGTITATTPLGPANDTVGDARDVVVTNPDGTQATKSGAFLYTVPAITISAISPSTAVPSGGTVVTITGAGFTNAVQTSVSFGGVPATRVIVVDAVTLRATAGAHASGPVNVAVTVGGNTATSLNGLTYATPIQRQRAARH